MPQHPTLDTMRAQHLRGLYEQHIKPLPPAERLSLLAMIADDLAALPAEAAPAPEQSILRLHGLGKELWQGIDAQAYVNQLRQEWDT